MWLVQQYQQKIQYFITFILIIFLPILGEAQVFKVTMPNGETIYTDNADKAYEWGKNTQNIMVLDKLPSMKTHGISLPQQNNTQQNIDKINPDKLQENNISNLQTFVESEPNFTLSKKGDYHLIINQPEVNRVYRRVSQPIEVQVTSTPRLNKGDSFIYLINGKHIATTSNNAISIATDDYNPEKYVLTVKIENYKGEIIASEQREFYILANNIAIQKKRKEQAEARKIYDSLPWYKK